MDKETKGKCEWYDKNNSGQNSQDREEPWLAFWWSGRPAAYLHLENVINWKDAGKATNIYFFKLNIFLNKKKNIILSLTSDSLLLILTSIIKNNNNKKCPGFPLIL